MQVLVGCRPLRDVPGPLFGPTSLNGLLDINLWALVLWFWLGAVRHI